MGLFSHLSNHWNSSTLIKHKKLLCGGLVVVFILFLCPIFLQQRSENTFYTFTKMYEELADQPDFEALSYENGELRAITYSNDSSIILSNLPFCISALEQYRVKGVQKKGNDIYFITKGIVDNYSGYVLTSDTIVDMQTLISLNRELAYHESDLFCFSFSSME